jgi:hypothetical protein
MAAAAKPPTNRCEGSLKMSVYQSVPPLAGEQVIFAADFTSSPILTNNKSGLLITPERLAVVHPQHVFVVFQVGQTISSSPIDKLAEVTVGRLVSQSNVRAASVAALLGFALLSMGSIMGAAGGSSVFLALILFGVAAIQVWLARHFGLTVQTVGGGRLAVRAQRDEYQALLAAADILQQLIVGRKPTGP